MQQKNQPTPQWLAIPQNSTARYVFPRDLTKQYVSHFAQWLAMLQNKAPLTCFGYQGVLPPFYKIIWSISGQWAGSRRQSNPSTQSVLEAGRPGGFRFGLG
jgi:hypothetical protein